MILFEHLYQRKTNFVEDKLISIRPTFASLFDRLNFKKNADVK